LNEKVNYLGHVISAEGITPDPNKVKAIQEMVLPSFVCDIRSILGMSGYYRKFVPNYADIARPLTQLTKKHSRFHWTDECQQSFDMLCDALVSALILAYPDVTKAYKLYTNASQYAVGGILTQDFHAGERVLQYILHQLSSVQMRWACIERQAYAIIYSISKLRHYLLGSRFIVYTDHKPLRSLFTSQMKNTRVQRWAILLDQYRRDIQYRSGKNIQ